MILYTNGCSFTQGHKDHALELAEDGIHKIKKDAPWAWPRKLEDYFDTVVNEGWCGGSNDRIFRRTLEYAIKQDNLDEHIFILQLTNVYRSEWYSEDDNCWIGIINELLMFDDKSWNDPTIDKKHYDKLSNGRRELEYLQLTQNKKYLEFFMRLVAFDVAMKKLNAKVFYTSLSISNNPEILHKFLKEYIQKPIEYLQNKNLNKLYPAGLSSEDAKVHFNILDCMSNLEFQCFQPMSAVCKNLTESNTDQHPNSEGHTVFARYIINELRSREIL